MANRICHDSLFYERGNRRIFRKYLCFSEASGKHKGNRSRKNLPEDTGGPAKEGRITFVREETAPTSLTKAIRMGREARHLVFLEIAI
jgi:hypothetical protein